MRILHVTDTYLPTLGGIELHVHDLAERQSRRHDVAVLVPAVRGAAVEETATPVPVHRVPSPRVPLLSPSAAEHLVAAYDPDVIHAHLSVGSPFTWAVVRAATDRHVLATMHSIAPPSALAVSVGHRLLGTRHGHVVLSAVSRAAAESIAVGLTRRVPHVLPNGVDVGVWQVEPRPHDTFTFVTVGRLASRKRPLAMLSALAEVHAAAPTLPWRALFVGDGPEGPELRRRVAAAGLSDRVVLTGALDRRQIREVLSCSDVFVAPARLESFGIAALEARCAGLPVGGLVGSGLGEFVRPGTEGLLVEDDRALAEALHRLASRPEAAHAMARASRRNPPAMDWSQVLERHEQLYAVAREGVSRAPRAARMRVRSRVGLVG
jgi:glycosyltransferase involved in cell wall biosynthesis